MRIKNLRTSTLYKGVYIVLCAAALAIDFGIPQGRLNLSILNYYTTLSNIACLVFFTLAFAAGVRSLASQTRDGAWCTRTEGAIVFCIAVTGLIYGFMLAPQDFGKPDFFSFRNMMLHYAGPAMVLLDWLLFSPKGRFRALDPVRWLGIPLAYFGYILVRSTFAGNIGGTDSRFPYGFIDPAVQGGWDRMFWGVAEIAVGMAILGYLIYILDWLLSRRKSRLTLY